jgi:hypothetical protein
VTDAEMWDRLMAVLSRLREFFAGPYPFSPCPLDVLPPAKEDNDL